jgi:hypothetical protein
VNDALAQAKASGEFKGEPGYTPQKGIDYFDGADGKDGVSATHSWNGTVLTVTSASGTSSADLKGAKGDKGDTGSKGADGKTPIKGTDYFTEADKQEIAEQAASMVEIPDSAGYVVQDTAPTDTSVLWVDMSDDSNDGFQEAVNMALAQAKSSGEFDGKTPVAGTDYFTAADKTEMVNAVIAALPVYAGEVV